MWRGLGAPTGADHAAQSPALCCWARGASAASIHNRAPHSTNTSGDVRASLAEPRGGHTHAHTHTHKRTNAQTHKRHLASSCQFLAFTVPKSMKVCACACVCGSVCVVNVLVVCTRASVAVCARWWCWSCARACSAGGGGSAVRGGCVALRLMSKNMSDSGEEQHYTSTCPPKLSEASMMVILGGGVPATIPDQLLEAQRALLLCTTPQTGNAGQKTGRACGTQHCCLLNLYARNQMQAQET